MDNPSRRTILIAGTAGAAGVLAGCASSSAGRGATPEKTGPAPGHSSTQAAPGTLATLADIPVGHAVSVDLPGGDPGLVCRTSASSAVCFNATCPHEGCTVAPDGAKLTCPCHQSQFDPKTGAVLGGPAPTGLTKVAVHVTGGKVVAGNGSAG